MTVSRIEQAAPVELKAKVGEGWRQWPRLESGLFIWWAKGNCRQAPGESYRAATDRITPFESFDAPIPPPVRSAAGAALAAVQRMSERHSFQYNDLRDRQKKPIE